MHEPQKLSGHHAVQHLHGFAGASAGGSRSSRETSAPEPEDMESHGAHAEGNVIESWLQMVRRLCRLCQHHQPSLRQPPNDPKLNPSGLSITELEFNEAMRLNRPILLFIMDDKHPLVKADAEADPDKSGSLASFAARRTHARGERSPATLKIV